MKRDMDVVRSVLLQVESATETIQFAEREEAYHAGLLIDADLLNGEALRDGQGQVFCTAVMDMTMAGHEFLDSARSEEVWQEARESIAAKGLAATLDVLKTVLTGIIATRLAG